MFKTKSQQLNEIYVSGSSVECQLGVMKLEPLLNYPLRQVFDYVDDVAVVRCGGMFSYILTNDNKLFACGRSSLGQCGVLQTSVPLIELTIPQFQSPNSITHIDCGEEYCTVVINDIDIYVCGMGFDSLVNHTFAKVETTLNSETDRITQISTSNLHAVFVVNHTDVYTIGSNIFGNCGRGIMGDITVPFGPVAYASRPVQPRIKTMKTGALATLLLFESGELFSCFNKFLQLHNTDFAKPQLPFQEPIKELICAPIGTHFAFITVTGDVWFAGSNHSGQLLQGHFVDIINAVKVDIYSIIGGAMPFKIHMTRGRTFISTSEAVYACGNNKFGSLGIEESPASAIVHALPVPLESKEVVQIVGGYDHTFIFCRYTRRHPLMTKLYEKLYTIVLVDLEICTC